MTKVRKLSVIVTSQPQVPAAVSKVQLGRSDGGGVGVTVVVVWSGSA